MMNRVKKIFNKSIYNKLILSYIFIIITPIVVIGYLAYYNIAEEIKSNYNKDNMEILKFLDTNLQTYFSEFESMTYNAILSSPIQKIITSDNDKEEVKMENQWSFQNFAIDLFGIRQDIDGAFLIMPNGYVYSKSSTSSILEGKDVKKEAWFGNVQNSNGAFLIIGSHSQKYKMNFVPSEYILTAARKIKNYENQSKEGIFLIDIKLNIFEKLFEKIDNRGRDISIIDDRGSIVFDSNRANIGRLFKDAHKGMSIGTDGEGINLIKDSKNYMIYYNSEALHWKFVDIVSVDSLLTKLRSTFFMIMILGALIFLVFLVISIYIARSITEPIKVLEMSMRKVEQGDFKQKLYLEGGGEIESLTSTFNRMVEKIQALITEVYENEIKSLNSQFKALQAQINPHFLYNTLESINSLAQINGIDDISKMVRALAKMFRYSVRKDKGLVTLRDEIDHVNDYVTLQSIRFNGKFEVSYDIPEELLNTQVLKLMLQPIVENAINHGVVNGKAKGKGRITIVAYKIEDGITIEVWNNGKPINEGTLKEISEILEGNKRNIEEIEEKAKSIGIFNVQMRIKLSFGKNFGLKIHSTYDEGTTVTIRIPATGGEDKNVQHINSR